MKFLRSLCDLFQTLESEVIENKEGLPTHNEEIMVSNQPKEDLRRVITIFLLRISILGMSRNCLKKANIHTLGDLINKKVSDLLEIKNFGKKSLKEVREKLSQFNMSLPDDDGSIDGGNDE